MKTRRILLNVIITFAITLVISCIVTLLWNLIIEKTGAVVDWKTSFRLALIIGIVIPIAGDRGK